MHLLSPSGFGIIAMKTLTSQVGQKPHPLGEAKTNNEEKQDLMWKRAQQRCLPEIRPKRFLGRVGEACISKRVHRKFLKDFV